MIFFPSYSRLGTPKPDCGNARCPPLALFERSGQNIQTAMKEMHLQMLSKLKCNKPKLNPVNIECWHISCVVLFPGYLGMEVGRNGGRASLIKYPRCMFSSRPNHIDSYCKRCILIKRCHIFILHLLPLSTDPPDSKGLGGSFT